MAIGRTIALAVIHAAFRLLTAFHRGRLVSVQNYSSYYWHGYGGQRGMNQMTQNVIQEAPTGGSGESEGALSLGQIKITATVNVTFEIE